MRAVFRCPSEHAAGIAAEIVESMAATGRGMAYLIPLLCLVGAGRRGRMAALPLGTAAALAGFLVFAYLHPARGPAQWIGWSAARVLAPLRVLFALAAAGGRDAWARPTPARRPVRRASG